MSLDEPGWSQAWRAVCQACNTSYDLSSREKKRRQEYTHRENKRVGTQPNSGHRQGTERGLRRNHPASTLILDFRLQKCEKIILCCSNPPVCGVLLWQPEQTKAHINEHQPQPPNFLGIHFELGPGAGIQNKASSVRSSESLGKTDSSVW